MTMNRWGGKDYRGAHGIARWVPTDGATHIISLTPNDTHRWTVTLSALTPMSVFDLTWLQACRVADTGQRHGRNAA